MKLVLLSIAGLLIFSLGYLFLVQESGTGDIVTTASNVESLGTLPNVQCTSTTCIKNNTSNIPTKENIASTKNNNLSATATVQFTEFKNPSGFVHSEPFKMADYIGKKLILIEFITYTCINCQRTFPYMQQWHEKYKDAGLLVIGIHTPEFSYERDRGNLIAAMQKEGITFPIVQDNDYETWNAYKNRFWPHRYIIDYNGNVVFEHIGEGAYSQTEEVIQRLLAHTPSGA